jgi:ferrous-iron efflux pump FieF
MVYEAVQSLLDRQLPDEEIEDIRTITCSVEGVEGVHQIRTRMSGPVRFIQFHLKLADHMPLIEAHRISLAVEHKLLERFPEGDILIHQDPLSVVPEAE